MISILVVVLLDSEFYNKFQYRHLASSRTEICYFTRILQQFRRSSFHVPTPPTKQYITVFTYCTHRTAS